MATLVELAERHLGLRLVLANDPELTMIGDGQADDVSNDVDPPHFTTVTGTVSLQGFVEDAFPIIRSADDVTAELAPEGGVWIYAWWD